MRLQVLWASLQRGAVADEVPAAEAGSFLVELGDGVLVGQRDFGVGGDVLCYAED